MSPEPLPHLETFARAAELGGFTAAARELELSQAAVSQRIQQLETALNTSLFRRRGGRVVLTEAGQQLHHFARRILDLHDQARVTLTGARPAASGELILAASSIPGEHLLPRLLGEFRAHHPQVAVRMSVADTSIVLDLLERGKADLGMVGGRPEHAHLEYLSFCCDRMILIVPASHPWRRRKRVSIAELAAQPLIQRERGSGSRLCLDRALASAGQENVRLNVVMELGSNEAIKEAVQRGHGLAVLSRLAVEKEIATGLFHALAITGLHLDRELYIVRDRRRALSPPAQLFLAFLETQRG
jgi:DNA-binding transcriptional LysR family regulator